MISIRERCARAEAIAVPAAESTSSSRAASIGELVRIRHILARLPADDWAVLEAWLRLSAWLLRDRRLDARDAALRAIAALHADSSVWRVARRLERELARYVDRGSWRFDRDRGPPADQPRRASIYRALQLNGGRVPSRNTIWRALAGQTRPAQKLLSW